MTHEDDALNEEALPVTNTTKAPVNQFMEGSMGKVLPYGNGNSVEVLGYLGDEPALLEMLRLGDPEQSAKSQAADNATIRDAVRLGSFRPFDACLLKLRVIVMIGDKPLETVKVVSARGLLMMVAEAVKRQDMTTDDREYVDLLSDIMAGWMPTVVDAFADFWVNPVTVPGPVADFLRDREQDLRVYLGWRMRPEEVHEVYRTLRLDYVNA